MKQDKSGPVHMEATTPLQCTVADTIINFRCQGFRGHGKVFLAGIPDVVVENCNPLGVTNISVYVNM